MRSSFILSVLGIVALVTSGCAHVSDVTYPAESRVSHAAKGIRILTDYDDKRRLAIALALPSTNSVPVSVSPSESWLADAQGRHYRLVFEPLVAGGRDMTEDHLWTWYYISAYDPGPSASRLVFRKGSYSISVLYSADGVRQVAERQFVVDRYSVPYPIVWIGWWIYRPTSP
jgi:hypothetical protein